LDVSSIILAGGKGLRLGQEKTSVIIDDRNLLDWVVSRLSFIDGKVFVVTATEQPRPEFNGYPELRVVTDIYPGRGPLGGVYTGLVTSESLYNLVVGCDMPFLNQDLLLYMIRLAQSFDLVIPRWKGMVEPLHAVYSKGCLSAMEGLLEQGTLSVNKLVSLVKVRYVEAEEIARFDPKHLSFFNINTEADLGIARELARGI